MTDETALSAEDALANDLYVAVVNPDLTWWDDLTPEMQDGWRRGARLLAARSQPATEGLTRLRKAAQAVIDSCNYVDGTAQEMADDRALDRLRAALAATEPAGDERT